MNALEKITALRSSIKSNGLDGYLIPKADEYQGEFVAPYAERLKWLTGFTGSAGIAVVLMDKACVLTDGRYRLQIDQEVDLDIYHTRDSIKCGVAGWLEEVDALGLTIGFDPNLFTSVQINRFKGEVQNIDFKSISENLIDSVWGDQPSKPCASVKVFSEQIAGKPLSKKKAFIAGEVEGAGADAALITLPDSISWLLNARGGDIDYIPSVQSAVIIYADQARSIDWIIDPKKIDDAVRDHIGQQVTIVDEGALDALAGSIIVDGRYAPIAYEQRLNAADIEIIDAKDPCIAPKARKTPSEYEAIKRAHIVDGVAVTKFLYWLAEEGAAGQVSEMSAVVKIRELRAVHAAFKGNSFPTISGFGPNGAIVHYRSSEATDRNLEPGNLLLVDSGGQYYDGDKIAGTTDITRTIAIGTPSDEMRTRYTLVLKGHIALASAKFPKGTTGAQIDTLARAPLWSEGLDFAHGTGHGVGCYLAVHEAAASISPRGKEAFEEGMLISNEPGYYKDNEYGIRIENLVFVKEASATMFEFETLSYAPFDKALIDEALLTTQEKAWLNTYNAQIFDLIAPQLSDGEVDWLRGQLD